MARKKIKDIGVAVGPLLAYNLYRHGYGGPVLYYNEIAEKITAKLSKQKPPKKMTRQRVAAILNTARIAPETIQMISEATGISVEELMKPKPEGAIGP